MKIRYVNGADIRNTTNTDFAGFGTHEYDPAMPQGEVQIEDYLKPETALIHRLASSEDRLYRKGVAVMHKKLGRPLTPEEKIKIGKQSYRQTCALAQKEAQIKRPTRSFVKKRERRGRHTLVFVDGKMVRSYLDPYFFLGGHDLVYAYIPKNEIWIDTRNYKEDQPFVIIHELKERALMASGMDYDSAHDYALAEERYHRRKRGVAKFING